MNCSLTIRSCRRFRFKTWTTFCPSSTRVLITAASLPRASHCRDQGQGVGRDDVCQHRNRQWT